MYYCLASRACHYPSSLMNRGWREWPSKATPVNMGNTAMTISGALTKWQAVSRRPAAWLVCVAWCGAGLWLFLTAAIRQLAPLDPILIAPISLFPVLGVVMFWAMTRREGRRVVEFTCDEGSFRFRKVGSAQAETRALSEVARVQEVSERAGLIGYELIFRDGHKVFLERRLPNAEAAADWLRSHRQP